MFKRQFWFGLVAGLAVGAVLRQRRQTGLTQTRLDDYYRKRASFYNMTDYLYLGQFPRITMRETVMDMLQLKPGMRVLDFACGAGANFPYIMERIGSTGKLVATDYSQDMLDSAHTQFVVGKGWRNIELVQADAAEMQFDEPFDAVLCTLGLAVIPRYEKAIDRAWAALKPGGIFAVGDLKESTRWYTLPIRFVTDLMDVMIIADSTRRPWEWMQANGENYQFRDLFHGYFYAATVRKPAVTIAKISQNGLLHDDFA
jgi:demethylmenaquinone methyltransferase/2-methoxy-6-polyprenyl-1,4-benzoquinol methylase